MVKPYLAGKRDWITDMYPDSTTVFLLIVEATFLVKTAFFVNNVFQSFLNKC